MTNANTTVVASCDATSCKYNQAKSCTAGQIEVSFAGNKADCLTFSPASSSTGMGDSATKQ